ncbi:MAG: hypothetical protein FWC15_06440 [Fibromonadales bacterium]|nr:hypothetical protein [Fibromonadales bacterium]
MKITMILAILLCIAQVTLAANSVAVLELIPNASVMEEIRTELSLKKSILS